MKITRLTAENVKRLKAVDITPTGDLVQITGRNGAGKSSVLDAIMYALGGKSVIPSSPVRRGAEHAKVELDLGDIIVKRRFDADGGTALQVESKDGAVFKSPQSLLDALLGRMTFDPLAFLRLKPAEQLAMLRGLVKVDIDLDELDRKNAADYAKRTEVNRDEKQLRAAAEAIKVADDLPASPVDISALLQRVEDAVAHNANIETRKANRATVLQKANAAVAAAADLRARADRLRAEAAELDAKATATQADADREFKRLEDAGPLPEPIDGSGFQAELLRAQEVNRGIEERTRRNTLRAQADGMKQASDLLTAAIDQRARERDAAIAAADMPVPGLGFGNDEVTLNGLPFEQASDAEQLRTSLAIAMAANPKLRVIRVKDGSLLDENGLKLVAEMAAERDFQVWMECVDSSGKVGIVIEDGAVASVNPVGES